MKPSTPTASEQQQGTEDIWKDPKVVEDYRSAEKVTTAFATSLIEQSGILSIRSEEESLSILDNACGTGAVSAVLHEMLPDWKTKCKWKLTCADLSEAMVNAVKEKIEVEGWGNTDTAVADLQETGLPASNYSHVFASFAIMGVPKPQESLDECLRILKPGGTLAFTTWKKIGWSDDVNAAIATVAPDLPRPTSDEFLMSLGSGDEWHNPAWVESQLQKRGLGDIQVRLVQKTMATSTHSEMMPALTPIMLHLPARFWSEEQREKYGSSLAPAVSDYLTSRYGVDNPIPMDWIAIVATATKPVETN
ncbi:hypothetical protein MGYG_02101 [Nannizzia gypsea CBS 118893]|uniref:Methyltransferase domain-containing protein n=1 Tax=Arthroderma gypseum (strain ATCC MYA-4604 / CBS 118893) TaxID=535722 RepID=E4UPQ0_ARTGP|nr:hypothetical protein MGYG_02101 [Nannizzia gypsea CBS 118893]EFQ99087.1 hypothetical protein MGYG_02101 [Nannizzia gypsea CBS 118893]